MPATPHHACLADNSLGFSAFSANLQLCPPYACYGTWLREHTYCGTYPINQVDLDLYNCRTYFVIKSDSISKKSPSASAAQEGSVCAATVSSGSRTGDQLQ